MKDRRACAARGSRLLLRQNIIIIWGKLRKEKYRKQARKKRERTTSASTAVTAVTQSWTLLAPIKPTGGFVWGGLMTAVHLHTCFHLSPSLIQVMTVLLTPNPFQIVINCWGGGGGERDSNSLHSPVTREVPRTVSSCWTISHCQNHQLRSWGSAPNVDNDRMVQSWFCL